MLSHQITYRHITAWMAAIGKELTSTSQPHKICLRLQSGLTFSQA
jgi:hypothetical protein